MPSEPADKVTQHIKAGFNAIRIKIHLEEIIGDLLDVVTRFHHGISHVLRQIAQQLPVINLLIDSIGNIAALAKIRKKSSSFEKRALGFKVTSGLITAGIAIAAFAVPHLSLPLIVAGSATNLVYSYFSIYKINRRKRELEHELRNTLQSNSTKHQQLEHKLKEIRQDLAEHKEKIVHKTVSTLTSTILLISMIVMLANPFTIAPVSIVLAVTSIAYTCYHFRTPIVAGITRVSNAIKNVFVSDTTKHMDDAIQLNNKAPQAHQNTTLQQNQKTIPQPAAAAVSHFLNQQQHVLSHAAEQQHDTFAAHHTAPTLHSADAQTKTQETHPDLAVMIPTAKMTPLEPSQIAQTAKRHKDEDDDGGEGAHEDAHEDHATEEEEEERGRSGCDLHR